jgi:predicted lysophospholipase L1 biosynthesis ABC-type transport system permease subunit
MTRPHGQVGKAYAVYALLVAGVIVTAISVAIIFAPFWIVVFTAMVILIVGAVLIGMASSEG